MLRRMTTPRQEQQDTGPARDDHPRRPDRRPGGRPLWRRRARRTADAPRPSAPRRRGRTWAALGGLALTLTLVPPADAGGGDGLARQLDRVLADPRLDGGAVSVVVRDADSGELRYARHPKTRLMPASNTKLVTSAAAMELLGPDHRFRTEVLADGRRVGGVLHGDLYLRGTGDPTMLAEDYDRLAAELADAGIRRVTGRLIGDDTRFDRERLGRGWAADDESAYYSSQISPLTVAPDTDYDAGTVRVAVSPGAEPGDRPTVTLTPPNDYVTVDVTARTVAADEPDTLSVDREHGGNTLTVRGDIPVDAKPTTSWVSVWEPTGYAVAVFADALAEHGVRVTGGPRVGRAAPKDAEVLAVHRSMPLRELLVPFLKLSNNNHAEVLTKAIGYATSGEGSWRAGLAAIERFLADQGVDTATLRQVDGSGLSRMNLLPSEALATLLTSVRDKPWFDDWQAALPVACAEERMVGGTLRDRMCGTAAEGNARAKTGSLTGASALSGYVTDADGRELVFSVVLNGYLADSVKDIEDAVVVTLAEHRADGGGEGARPAGPTSGARTAGPAGLECSWVKPNGC